MKVSTWWRFLATLIATGLAINLTWMLIRPAMPLVVGLIFVLSLAQLLRWYRGRW